MRSVEGACERAVTRREAIGLGAAAAVGAAALALAPELAEADTYTYALGSNLTMTIDGDTHTVTISGTGAMDSSVTSYNFLYIKNVIIEEGVTTVADFAFRGTGSASTDYIENVSLPSTLVSIGCEAFACQPIGSITIPGGVEQIGMGAFVGCSNVLDIVFEGDAPTITDTVDGAWLEADYVFGGTDVTVHYYTNTSGWTDSYKESLFSATYTTWEGTFATNVTWVGSLAIYRLYNQYSGEHLFTTLVNEYTTLVGLGWTYEGVNWGAPESGTSVYRLYNQYSGDHHYTSDANEYATLGSIGWTQEGEAFCSDDGKSTPVYRLYNPYASSFYHHYTTDANERDTLVGIGWEDEGVGWYGI